MGLGIRKHSRQLLAQSLCSVRVSDSFLNLLLSLNSKTLKLSKLRVSATDLRGPVW